MKKHFVILSLLTLASVSGPILAATGAPIAPPMVTIKGGTFSMGSTANPKSDNYPVSEPVHTVKIKTFRLAKYETTVQQFRQFVDATGYKADGDCWKLAANESGVGVDKISWSSPAIAPSDAHPVMCVSWDDAHAYLRWLSEQTGKRFRLPSEAEWEYAARAGSSARYPFGDDPAQLCKHANVFDRSTKAAIARLTGKSTRTEIACDDQAELTTVVGMYAANAFGLHDMLGNVGELVEDCQHLTYERAPGDGTAWTNACAAFHGGAMVIHRGGSYNAGQIGAGPAFRGHAGKENRSSLGEGFRIAEDIVDAKQAAGAKAKAGQSPFEAGLAVAQTAERARRAQVVAGSK